MMTDIRFALRSLAKAPGFTAIVLITLGLGIGADTAMFTLVNKLFFESVPFPQSEQLLTIFGTSPQNPRDQFAFAETEELRAQAAGPEKSFESITAYAYWNNTYSEPNHPAERFLSLDATADFFKTFKVQPILGRAYTAEEQVPGRNTVALLSYHIWQSRFAGDPAVIGRTIRLNAEQVTIIGVMPASFVAPLFFGPVDIWRPITIPRHIVEDRNNRFFQLIGRLNPGVSPTRAISELTPVAGRWAKDYPQSSKDRGFNLMPPHKAAMDSTSTIIVWLLFGLGGAVLLVACANIANLQLARATANIRDLAIRSALGASRAQLIVHQLVESLILAFGGGICGLFIASGINTLFGQAIWLGSQDNKLDLPMNGRVMLAAFIVSGITGLLFGLLPAWFASRENTVSTLKQQARGSTSGRGPRLMRQALIVTEIGVAITLLGVASMMIRGFNGLLQRDKGWDTQRILAANIHLPEQSTYRTDESRRIAIEKLTRRLAQIPGAEHTAISSTAPLFDASRTASIEIEGQPVSDPSKLPLAGETMVGSEFFATLGIPLLEGRIFAENVKADGPPTIIINESMARHFWPGKSAIGQRVGERSGEKVIWREVIGVVRDIQYALNPGNPPTIFQMYKPLVDEPWGYLFLLVRGTAPASYKTEVRKIVTEFDPDLVIQEMYTIPEAADRFEHNFVVINDTLAGFAALGLILAAVGLYGVISYLVAQRTNEFGIRIALGAKASDVLMLVLRQGIILTFIGVFVGLLGAFALNQVLQSAMPRLAGSDPVALLGTAVVLVIVSLASTYVPAMRATKVDPIEALRAE